MNPSAGPAPAVAAGARPAAANDVPAAANATTTAAPAGQQLETQSAINPFSFSPQLLLADLSNAALDACADGFDALERQLLQALPLERPEKAALRDGVGQLWAAVLSKLNDAATSFERVAAATALHVPAELSAEEEEAAALAEEEAAADAPTTTTKRQFPLATEEDEAALDGELEELRAALAAARGDVGRLRRELSAAAGDRAAAAEAAPALRPLGAALASNRASVLEDVAAVSGVAARLRPLMARCEQLRGAALAAARRRVALVGGGGGNDEGAAAASAAATGADDAPAAAKAVREMMVDTGAGADQLRQLCEAFGGADAMGAGGGGEEAAGGAAVAAAADA